MLERDVKRKVSALFSLAMEHDPIYVWMPVTTTFGKRGLDYICCVQGEFVAVETKRPKEHLRPDQRQRARDMCMAGARVFIISSPEGYGSLERYLVRKIPSLKNAVQKVAWV